jgi:hypothetical protein
MATDPSVWLARMRLGLTPGDYLDRLLSVASRS